MGETSKPKSPLFTRRKIVAMSLVVLLSIGLSYLAITAYLETQIPNAQITNASATGSYCMVQTEFGLLPGCGLLTQGSASIEISGSGTIVLNQINVTLGNNLMTITRLYAQGWASPLGHALKLPVDLSINFNWDNWPNLTTNPTSTLIVTISGYWSRTSEAPNNPMTLTAEETLEWTVSGSP